MASGSLLVPKLPRWPRSARPGGAFLTLRGRLAEHFGKGRRVIGGLEVSPYQHGIRLHAVLKMIRHKLLTIEPFPHFSHFQRDRLPGIEPQLHRVQHGLFSRWLTSLADPSGLRCAPATPR